VIISLSGLPRAGKDIAANAIKTFYPNVLTYSFATPIKKALCEVFGWSIESFDLDNKDQIDSFWGVSKRQMLEYVGTNIFRKHIRDAFPPFDKLIGDTIWIKRLELFIKDNSEKDIIITDLRFIPEYRYLISMNAQKIYISRPNCRKLDITKQYETHLMKFNYELENSIEGDVVAFEKKSIKLYEHIKELNK